MTDRLTIRYKGQETEYLRIEPRESWVRVSTELLAELGEWSEPVRIRILEDDNGVLEMLFKTERSA